MPDLHPLAIAAMVGLLSGAHAAIWGMYKDSMYEGFTVACFLRSIVVGVVVATAIQAAIGLSLPAPAAIVMLFGIAYAAERGIVEVWKTFVRDEDQSKFFIPMAFSIRGIPVASRSHRLAAGAGYVAVVSLCLLGIAQLDRGDAPGTGAIPSALVGLIVGIIIAIGGAWKDAPKEGFSFPKFFRSPSMTLIGALALSTISDSYLHIAVAAIGYERAAVETWKTLLTHDAPPGKFRGKPELHPEMRVYRKRGLPAFLGIWALILAAGALAAKDSPRVSALRDAIPAEPMGALPGR